MSIVRDCHERSKFLKECSVQATPLDWKQVRKRPQQLGLPRGPRFRRPAKHTHTHTRTERTSARYPTFLSFSCPHFYPSSWSSRVTPQYPTIQPYVPYAGKVDPSFVPAPLRSTQMERSIAQGLGIRILGESEYNKRRGG